MNYAPHQSSVIADKKSMAETLEVFAELYSLLQ